MSSATHRFHLSLHRYRPPCIASAGRSTEVVRQDDDSRVTAVRRRRARSDTNQRSGVRPRTPIRSHFVPHPYSSASRHTDVVRPVSLPPVTPPRSFALYRFHQSPHRCRPPCIASAGRPTDVVRPGRRFSSNRGTPLGVPGKSLTKEVASGQGRRLNHSSPLTPCLPLYSPSIPATFPISTPQKFP